MGSYRKSRFPKRSALLVLAVAAFFLLFQLMTSNIPSTTSRTSFKPRIAIATFTTDEKSYTHLSLKTKNLYARKHGYDLFVDWEANDPRGTTWHKFVMLEQIMNDKKHDWIFWIDFDTLITNATIKLEDIIQESLANATNPNEIDYLFTGDCFQLNNGAFLVRSRPSALSFLNAVRAHGDANRDLSEQDCMRDVVNNDKNGEAKQALWIPQWKINAFPDEIKCWDKYGRGWERGMFVVHFAGAWAHVKEDDPTGFLMRKYENDIIWP